MPSRDLVEDLRVRVDEQTRDELERIAERDERSLAAVIRRFIRAGIEADAAERDEVAA